MFVILILASFWKSKWRNLRDIYIRKKKEARVQKSGQAAKKIQKYVAFQINDTANKKSGF